METSTSHNLKRPSFLKAWITMFHLKSSVIGTIYMLLGVYLASDRFSLLETHIIFGAIFVFCIIVYSFVINDLRDVPTDKIEHPDRPIASGVVTEHQAKLFCGLMLLIAFGIGLSLSPFLFFCGLINVLIATAYSYRLKNTLLIGNMSIAYLDASTLLFGGLLMGNVTLSIVAGIILIFLFVLAQEVLFAMRDIEGDRMTGYKTTATRLGKTNGLRLYKMIAVLFIIAVFMPAILGWAQWSYLIAAIPLTVVPLLSTIGVLTWKATHRTIVFSTRIIIFLWISSFLPIALLK